MLLEKAMAWRVRMYGYPCLTPREHEAVTRERKHRAGTENLSRIELDVVQDKLLRALWKTDERALQRAQNEMREELLKIVQAERGIQTRVAGEMGITKQTVSELLARAGSAMRYFVERWDPGCGWRRDEEGCWWLIVPVAPIDGHTRQKIRK